MKRTMDEYLPGLNRTWLQKKNSVKEIKGNDRMGKRTLNNIQQKDCKTKRRKDEQIEPIPTGSIEQNKVAYEIRIANHLEQHWADWFDGWTITNVDNNEVILTCSGADHAGLHGVLDKIRDLNLTLISVKRISMEGSGSRDAQSRAGRQKIGGQNENDQNSKL